MAIGLALILLAGCGSTQLVVKPPVTRTVTVPASSDRGDARAAPGGHACGTERWAVKVGTDASAAAVSLSPRSSSIAVLAAAPAPRNPSGRTAGVEEHAYTIRAVVQAVKEEADSDYHLALADGAGRSMIAEAPDPACAGGSRFASQIAAVRAELNRACPRIPTAAYRQVALTAELTGVGFFDRIHGQRGVAPNGIELHPLLAVKLSGRC